MGKPTGFLEHTRELPENKKATERIKNYKEFVQDEKFGNKIIDQASRCMDCGIPFCHDGCPLGNIIPEFNEAVYNSDWEDAYKILISTNNFPEFTGRICPAPCEHSCVLGINQEPVTIENIEKNIIEEAFKRGYVTPLQRSDEAILEKKVAIIGSGPAGMACAEQLNKAGYQVTLFEKDSYIGGLLRYGIPDFKLDKSVVERRAHIMKRSGIEIRTNCLVGKDISVEALESEFDAIVIAIGSTVPRDLKIQGRELKGVHFAMEFLGQNNKKVSGEPFQEESIEAKGKHVIVIGGGDTGSDCVGTSNRQGAKSVTQFELLSRPPKNRNETMPWPMYARVLKTTTSHEEGCERKWEINTLDFIGKNGTLTHLKTTEVEWKKDDHGVLTGFKNIPHTEKEIHADLVFLAMGFLHPEHKGLVTDLNIELGPRKNIATLGYQTKKANIFSCGDARRGQSLVVWAIHEGRECAAQVDEFLSEKKPSSLRKKEHSKLLV